MPWTLQLALSIRPFPVCETDTILVDFAHVLRPLTTGKGSGARTTEHWSPVRRADLLSALAGGQWTQARKASVPAWGIEDKCFASNP